MSVFLTESKRIHPHQKRHPKPTHPWSVSKACTPPRPVVSDQITEQVNHVMGTTGCYTSHRVHIYD